MTGACFVDVTEGDSVDLTSIKVAGYTGECMDTVYVQVLNYLGQTTATYYWQDDNGGGDFDPGWYDEDYAPIAAGEVFIDAGTALWTSGDDGIYLTYSGQVLTAATAVPLRFGYTPVANPNAVAVDLTDILVTGYTGECMDTVNIQVLNYLGQTTATYYWQDDNGGGDFDPGWYDEDYAPIEEDTVIIQPGDGLWVAGDDGLEVVFPSTTVE